MKSLRGWLLCGLVLGVSLTMVMAEALAAEETGRRGGGEVLLVCPDVYRAAMKPWIEYRTKQGYTIRQISSKGTNEQIQKRIRAAASSKRPAAIVLVGDAAPQKTTDVKLLARSVPNFIIPAKVNARFNRTPFIGTDNNYADLDGDRIPDVPLGRLSVDTPEELGRVIKKIIAYESQPARSWQEEINLIAGVGGFGQLIDTALEAAAWQLIRQIPDNYRVTMTQGSWASPFCPPPKRFPAATMQRMNEGPFFWVYIGHSKRDYLARLRLPQCRRRLMTMKDLEQLRKGKGRTIALILACKAGMYDHKEDSLAERMLATPGGPIAVIAGSRNTMPYAMAILANGMIRQLFVVKADTLGEICLQAKRELAREKTTEKEDPNRAMIDRFAQIISPNRDALGEERLEHIELFNLFGDPLLKLPYPETIDLTATREVKRGKKIEISGTLPFDGRMTIELVRSRDRSDYAPTGRSQFPKTPEEVADMQKTYEKANRYYFHRQGETRVKAGPLKVSISVPKNAPKGKCAVRIYVSNGKKSATGAAEVTIL